MCLLSGLAGSIFAVAYGAVFVNKDSGVAHAEGANLSTVSKGNKEFEPNGSEEVFIDFGTSIYQVQLYPSG